MKVWPVGTARTILAAARLSAKMKVNCIIDGGMDEER
jgi:hypothetical protein